MNTLTPQIMKPVLTLAPVTTNGGVATDWVTMKDVNRLEICVQLTQAVGHATVLTLSQATTVAGAGAKVMTYPSQIWANEDVATTDTNVLQTAAKNYTVTADITNKLITFVIEPDQLDINNDFDCIKLTGSDSSQVTNLISVVVHAYMKYQGTTPPSIITD